MRKLVLFFLLVIRVCQGRVWYVREGGADENDGSNWETALKSPQVAIEHSKSGDEVWIAEGVYRATWLRDVEGGNLFAASFMLKSGISLYGGFGGNEQHRNERLKDDGGLYRHKTILESSSSYPGTVLYGGRKAFGSHVALDGLVLRNGNACSRGMDGYGGGACLPGNCEISRCEIRGNRGIHGGGIYACGEVVIRQCVIAENDVIDSGCGGRGGGVYAEAGVCLENCMIAGNGQKGAIQGGGCYLGEGCVVRHCTIVGNRALQAGSGCMTTGKECCLENSVVWGNRGPSSQVAGKYRYISHCGVEGQELSGDSICLTSANCGSAGVNANQNEVGVYYPCFRNVTQGDFRLGDGSYLINRGKELGVKVALDGELRSQQGSPDIGCHESSKGGNLAISFMVALPCIYGSIDALKLVPGCCSPPLSAVFYSRQGQCNLNHSADGWKATWLRAGEMSLSLEVRSDEKGRWNPRRIEQKIKVEPRPLMIVAEDAEGYYGEPLPTFQWSLKGGQLMPGDSIVGDLACIAAPGINAITQGDLAVKDGNDGKNYTLLFVEGEFLYESEKAEVSAIGLSPIAKIDTQGTKGQGH